MWYNIEVVKIVSRNFYLNIVIFCSRARVNYPRLKRRLKLKSDIHNPRFYVCRYPRAIYSCSRYFILRTTRRLSTPTCAQLITKRIFFLYLTNFTGNCKIQRIINELDNRIFSLAFQTAKYSPNLSISQYDNL